MTAAQRPDKHGVLWRFTVRPMIRLANWIIECGFLIVVIPLALLARIFPKKIDVGLGPEPLVNNVYHKKALESAGYSAETYVDQVWYITSEFDVRGDLRTPGLSRLIRPHYLFLRSLFRYRIVYLYFNGGPLMFRSMLWRLEPLLYRIAGVRTVVMPYGGDVQDMTRSPNLLFKHVFAIDYPDHRLSRSRIARKIDLWTRNADHIISGVEWVDYLYYWDTLMLGHFSIDPEKWSEPSATTVQQGPLRILHAPNHREIKGTGYFVQAVKELREEGVDVELLMLEQVSNEVVRETMRDVDVVADQLVVGWYAMFALEAMAAGKPVLCYLRPDLVELYESAGLVGHGEIPIISCTPLTVKDAIRDLALDRGRLPGLGARGQAFVRKHHSLEVVGRVFDRINRSLDVAPANAAGTRK